VHEAKEGSVAINSVGKHKLVANRGYSTGNVLQLPEDRLLMYGKVKLVAFVGQFKIIFFP